MNSSEDSGDDRLAAVFLGHVAKAILAQHPSVDLRDIVVLLPNYHVAQPLAQALIRHTGGDALLLPKMVTLNDWAQSLPLSNPITPESCRTVWLYQALQTRRWFGDVDYWSMAQELLQLFDELTQSLTVLPVDVETFSAALAQAYQARSNESMQFEARLVYELWFAMQQGNELDTTRAYQQRLAGLAANATRPLFVLRTYHWNALEQRFLDEYATLAPVTVFDLRQIQQQQPSCALLNAAFSQISAAVGAQTTASLRVQADVLRLEFPAANLSQRLRLFGAHSLEHEAAAAALQVRCWLAEGRRSIALVAQDREVARRLRALLERADVWVSDETGWTFSTLSVSTVLMSWLDVMQSDFYHHDLLDLLKSPTIFADLDSTERKSAVYQLEQLLREHNVVSKLSAYIAIAAPYPELLQLLHRLCQAEQIFSLDKKRSLADWLATLRDSLQVLAIDIGWRHDEAGVQLLQALQIWQDELAQERTLFAFGAWRRWLAQRLDELTFRDSRIDSPVRFTHLAATRWRSFDGVIILGADADHLPAVANFGRWFNDGVRHSLNLPTLAQRAAQQRDDLQCLLAMNSCLLATWQASRQGEECLLSPYLEILRDLHQLTFQNNLDDIILAGLLAAEKQIIPLLPLSTAPQVVIPAGYLPQKISISAYNSLVACPYQFYARYVLKLNELDEVRESLEKRDYGDRVHQILHRFHEQYRQLTDYSIAALITALEEISQLVFADLLQDDFLAQAWLARWLKAVPAYVENQMAGVAQGWHYQQGETPFKLQLEGVELYGRIDRLDVNDDQHRVLDYKLQSLATLRNKLREPGEDVQLACYAAAYQAQVAAFVGIDGEVVKEVAPAQAIETLSHLNLQRLTQLMKQLKAGEFPVANGIEAVCQHCEMHAICRKAEWQNG